MQFLSIQDNLTLSQLNKLVGSRNTDSILNVNGLTRSPQVGKQLTDKCNSIINSPSTTIEGQNVNTQRKLSILNTFTKDSDIYEYAALSSEDTWRVISSLDTFPGMLRIPDSITLPDNYKIIGNNIPVSDLVYNKVTESLTKYGTVNPNIFNEYSSINSSNILNYGSKDSNPIQWFNLPWGQITLYSSIDSESMDFPVYPENISDGVSANYDTMPDMIYQYEPWQVYQSTGPRSITYEFHMHRDMWSGNHNDGRCYDLVNFCKAQLYAKYNGAAVHTANCIMYIAGKVHLAGIVTNVEEEWGGPIGHDGWYLELTLRISMTEVSQSELNYDSVRNKTIGDVYRV